MSRETTNKNVLPKRRPDKPHKPEYDPLSAVDHGIYAFDP